MPVSGLFHLCRCAGSDPLNESCAYVTTSAPAVTDTRKTVEADRTEPKAWGAVFVALLILTFGAAIARAALNAGMPAVNVAAFRLLVAWIVITPLVLLRHRDAFRMLERRHILLAWLAGFWLAVHFVALAFALDYARIMVVQTLINTIPLWAALLETTVLRTRLPRVVWIGLTLTILGSGLIAVFGWLSETPPLMTPPETVAFGARSTQTATLGALLAIFGAITAAVYLVIGRRVRADVPLMPYIWMLFGSAALIGMVFVAITRTPVTGYDGMAYFWLILLALGPQLVAHSCINYALAHIPATVVSLASQFITITAPVVAFFAFAEVPTLVEMVGSAIIASGVVIALAGQIRSRR